MDEELPYIEEIADAINNSDVYYYVSKFEMVAGDYTLQAMPWSMAYGQGNNAILSELMRMD